MWEVELLVLGLRVARAVLDRGASVAEVRVANEGIVLDGDASRSYGCIAFARASAIEEDPRKLSVFVDSWVPSVAQRRERVGVEPFLESAGALVRASAGIDALIGSSGLRLVCAAARSNARHGL